MFIFCNPNPENNLVGDCVIRAIAIVTNEDWDTVYAAVCVQGYSMKDMPSSNSVWGAYLSKIGFKRFAIPNECPDCYTIRDFCSENETGRFILATGTHAVASIDGDYYDTWDSGGEIPVYFWQKEI